MKITISHRLNHRCKWPSKLQHISSKKLENIILNFIWKHTHAHTYNPEWSPFLIFSNIFYLNNSINYCFYSLYIPTDASFLFPPTYRLSPVAPPLNPWKDRGPPCVSPHPGTSIICRAMCILSHWGQKKQPS